MKFIEVVQRDSGVREVWLNRPEIHNAFNAELIQELISFFEEIGQDKSVRLVVLSGRGSSFCAGADLNWMRAMKDYSQEENFRDSKELARMFSTINACDVPVIGQVNGHALGGGVGLVSVCDYAVAVDSAKFGFTEVRLGLLPAVISPYCLAKIGEANGRAWMLSGERFTAEEARTMGLVQEVVLEAELHAKVESVVRRFLLAGPEAAREAKKLIRDVMANPNASEDLTCRRIAERRVSQEGQEGMRALLDKKQPKWVS